MRIGVFDSGVGGLTVLQSLIKKVLKYIQRVTLKNLIYYAIK